jgi:hypothetical protein
MELTITLNHPILIMTIRCLFKGKPRPSDLSVVRRLAANGGPTSHGALVEFKRLMEGPDFMKVEAGNAGTAIREDLD